jgi:hypothetical protein
MMFSKALELFFLKPKSGKASSSIAASHSFRRDRFRFDAASWASLDFLRLDR